MSPRERRLISRRLFLGQISAASALTLGESVSPAATREVLSSIFEDADPAHDSSAGWKTFGRIGLRRLKDSVLIEDGFTVQDGKHSDCEFSFAARAPENSREVQIWAGIRCRDRDSRYVFALRGGKNDDVYLARYAPDGQSRFLGFAPLDFHPTPGTWYRLRAVTTGNRIRIYVNDEDLPRLNVQDEAPLWNEGGVSLGGGWLPVEFRDASVKPLSAPDSAASAHSMEQVWQPVRADKISRRVTQRSAYHPMVLGVLNEPRTEFSLNGEWLFMPDPELSSTEPPEKEIYDDGAWHIMDVPNFWTPSLTWLHGETGFPELDGISSTKGISDNLWKAELERVDNYTFAWRETVSGWYRQYIELPATAGHRFELCFDAIAKVAEVWVNGAHVGSHMGMFGEVRCDITDRVHPGKNTIAVHVVGRLKQQESNRVMGVAVTVEVTEAMLKSLPHGMYRDEAAGIWQPAKLVITQDTWIEDVFTKPSLDHLEFELLVRSRSGKNRNVQLTYAIYSNADNSVFYEAPAVETLRVESTEQTFHFSASRLTPKLWSPSEPNLYRIELALLSEKRVVDRRSVLFGFRTFEVRDGRLLLNGKPFWLRGANHFPHALRPNDAELARRFLQLAREGNVVATRSHTAPFSETWLQAADEVGMAVSFEGTWPWLMLEGDPPSDELLQTWSSEFLSLIRKHRNHPAIILWTVNNEMKFESADRAQPDRLRRKWEILSQTVKAMRAADPTRPVVCDSSYCRKSIGTSYEDLVKPSGFDDGDIDDAHRYPGWYEPSFFHYFRGEFGRDLAYPGRPLISQEMSTGYPRNDDGHPTRFYLFKHYTPQSLVGYEAYENRDPAIFLERQALITKELAEAIRRTNRDECSGILHFAYLSWFEDAWNERSIHPFRTRDALKLALQPVLVSAELFGRHFYAGSQQKIRVCICNDAADTEALPAGELEWQIEDEGKAIARGAIGVGPTSYYANQWCDLQIPIPVNAAQSRYDVRLRLFHQSQGVLRGENAYDITIASQSWAWQGKSIQATVLDKDEAHSSVLREIGVRAAPPSDLKPSEIAIVTNGEHSLNDPRLVGALRAHALNGGRVLVFNSGTQLAQLFPDQIKGYLTGSGEIATMRVSESPVFDGLAPLDLSWWELGSGQLPRVCRGSHQVLSGRDDVKVLAEVVNTHGYLQRSSDFGRVSGSPLLEVRTGAGRWIACELMLLDAAPFDPIAKRLLSNLIENLNERRLS